MPAPSGITGQGKAGHGVNVSEALLMLRNCDSPGRVALPGSQGHAVETRQTAVKDIAWPCGHRCLRSTEDTQPQPFLMRVEHGNRAPRGAS
jgi:hypothetical protein